MKYDYLTLKEAAVLHNGKVQSTARIGEAFIKEISDGPNDSCLIVSFSDDHPRVVVPWAQVRSARCLEDAAATEKRGPGRPRSTVAIPGTF